MSAVPPQLKTLYREGRLIIFVGAGVSSGVSWTGPDGAQRRGVSWRELVDRAVELLGHGDPDLLRVRGTDLQILEYFRAKNSGSAIPLTNWFLQQMAVPDDALLGSEVHLALAAMEQCNLFYTTNFDDFLERSFRLAGRPYSAIASEDQLADHFVEASQSGAPRAEIVKFHGDLNHPERMVLSESDYAKRMEFSEAEDQRLISDLLGRAILFVGYSFSDANVAYLFRQVQRHGDLPQAPGAQRGYITSFDPSDFERTLFDERGMAVVGVDSARKSASLAEFLRELAS